MTEYQTPPQWQPPQPMKPKKGMPTWAIATLASVAGVLLLCGLGVVAVAVNINDSGQTSSTEDDGIYNPSPAEPANDDPEPEPEPDPEPAMLSIGDSAEIEELGDVLGSITVSNVEMSTSPASQYGRQPKHNHYLIFTIDLEAEASMDVFSQDFYVLMPDGERFDAGNGNAWDAIDLDDELGFAELDAGQHRSGVIAFDLPKRHGELAYAPNFEGGPIVSWEFDQR